MPLSVWLDDISSSTYQGWRAASGSIVPGTWASARSSPARGISSNAVNWSAVAARACAKRAIASSIRARPRNAVSISRGFGKQLDRRRGDDAERALAADEQLLQIVAGVVLAQAPEPVPDAPVGQHHLDSQGEFAGIAVAQHRDAAGIGRNVAADLAAAFRTEAQRKQPVDRGRRLVQVGEDAAGLDGHREVDRIDRAYPVHPAECQHDIIAVRGRDPAADQPGIAALRHDRQPGLSTNLDDRGHLRRRTRPHDEPCRPAIKPPRLGEIRLHVPRIGDPSQGPDRVFD